ncbi:PAS domain-containing protein [Dictyobacter kobayashii]|uniref:PAS domain-containing protein n=1 Tax=Dictyobacter kobayashii TaxID=2014872 RepID=A0A402AHF2_9CHLR|nr:PAS domain-containing protein [Dictyobacter kobayashii]GCE18540.1 hypothetical protein KDK_23400 [Dictyobacter kobayashii]
MQYIDATTIQLEALFLSLPDGVIIKNLAGKIQRINPAAQDLFELASENKYQGMPFEQFINQYHPHEIKLFPSHKMKQDPSEDKKKRPQLMLPLPNVLRL